MHSSTEQVFADLGLSRRLERCEARSNAEFVETRAALTPESGACWIDVGGTWAMYDGPISPLTQTFGLGLFESPTSALFGQLEQFFLDRGGPIYHEVSPLADNSLLSLLGARGYLPVEHTSVLFLPLGTSSAPAARRSDEISVRQATPVEWDLWAQLAARGWSEFHEVAGLMLSIAEVSVRRPGAFSFLAECDGVPIATGAMTVWEGVALLAGASTVPEGRRRGAQLAMLEARLRWAREIGCDLVMMCAQPGSASQRNAERQGFHIAYTRTKWHLDTSGRPL